MKLSLHSNKDTTFTLSGKLTSGEEKVGPVKGQLQQDSPGPRGGNGGSYTGEHQTNQAHPDTHKPCAPRSKVGKAEGQTLDKTNSLVSVPPPPSAQMMIFRSHFGVELTVLPRHFLLSEDSGSLVR